MMKNPTRGDIIVFEKKKTFPRTRIQKYKTVVKHVEQEHVICGLDGRIHKDDIVEIKGKSPDYIEEKDKFNKTL